jgi:hypothetical protein
MPLVTLPPGCTGLDGADGSKTPPARPGSTIEVSSQNAKYLKNSWYGQTGVITETGFSFGTKGTRRCEPCRRSWNVWNAVCPRCGRDTEPEATPQPA